MFATPHYMDSMPEENARKRAWEAEDSIGGFSEHRTKRIHCLPFRAASPSFQSSETIAPLESESEQFVRRVHHDDSSLAALQNYPSTTIADPSRLQYSQDTTRIPTPIMPSFAAQVRGQQCGVSNMGHHHLGLAGHDDQSVPRSMEGLNPEWQQMQNNHRLPSPISEDAGSPSMAVDADGANDAASHQLSTRLRNSSISNCEHDMEHPNAMGMSAHSPPPSSSAQEGDPESPSPSRKSHMRNKHTINSWTWQPGMKRSFSMGYRADCEKCRAKVPGHFNHIIIS